MARRGMPFSPCTCNQRLEKKKYILWAHLACPLLVSPPFGIPPAATAVYLGVCSRREVGESVTWFFQIQGSHACVIQTRDR